MAVLNKSDIKPPTLPKETVTVSELGGDVIVRGLLLRERLDLYDARDAGNATIAKLLARTVVDAKHQPVFTEEEWEVFGARHGKAAIELFAVAKRLSGLDAEVAEKK